MDQADTSRRGFRVGLPNSADALSGCFATSYAGIIAFMAVATEGSFIKAGERLGIGRSAVCRNVQRLETQLSTRLFFRTTRSTSLTREGERFFENCNRGVMHIAEAMNDMLDLRQGPPRGLLRISSTVGFGRNVVAPLLSRFSERYPDIAVDLLLDDRTADFAAEQIDVAFRDGCIEDSSIIAKRLIPMQKVLCASPAYVEKHGLPSTVEELEQHNCISLRFSTGGRIREWEFKVDGRLRKYLPTARLTFNDADLVLKAVLEARGIAQMPTYQISDHIARKRLVTALKRHMPEDGGHYICYLCRQHLPSRIRVFVDFMTEQIRALDLNCLTPFNATCTEAPVHATAA
ncbi:LysR family transcriptional regulator [Paraburkholderia hospita]|jgi:DNA-binding transcriptional LysR family regulator|uniref:LysR family transcriptional regulator n=1 Tax=Paraburkholderia hospita TaxID=169430 RepID=A0AAJ4VXK3_9BURK|nr:LysR family transcriptional regulator [Paraburkholderia hospita]AUT71227.1 LysR family transcriptional regulator [Paraburkholderia hospita]AXF01729.1 LysR family transcriptional regulator [Paraburkholderia hospita]EIM96024.1 LysR family transcriptional regulator [Paraburkholderia hospita]OUL75437.1 LysR family transcriptional regulator [Paraburkholderia hospita]SEI26841.1 transcriptional regulator, LysR family [Paraburkholderia hospita]